MSIVAETLSVPEIHCGNCKESIEGALGGLSGVVRAEVSVDEKTVQVEWDDTVVDRPAITAAIVDQGFDVAEPAG